MSFASFTLVSAGASYPVPDHPSRANNELPTLLQKIVLCGVDSFSFPPTITELVCNILGNIHLILLLHPVSEALLVTFPRKDPRLQIFHFHHLRDLPNHLNPSGLHLRSFPLPGFLHLSLQTCSSLTPY